MPRCLDPAAAPLIDRSLARTAPLGSRVRASLREPAIASAVAAAGLILAAMLVRIWLVRKVAAPWLMGDELEYSDMAKSFAAHGDFLLRGQPVSFLSIYPAVIAPAWLAHSMATTYALAKSINVVVMTLAAVPVYLWARRLVPPIYAVLATALVLCLPTFAFTGILLTENVAFPAVLLSLYAMAAALERPTIIRQLLALALILVAGATRLQAFVLLAVYPTAFLVKLGFDSRAEAGAFRRVAIARLRSFVPSIAGMAVLLVGYVFYKEIRGSSLTSGLGIYQIVSNTHYSVRDVARWAVYHLAEIGFAVGVIPACALIILIVGAARRGAQTNEAERAFIGVTIAATLWFVVQVAAFASKFSLRIEERNMCYLEALLLLALVVWIARGAPRPFGAATLAVVIPIALLISIPFEALVTGAVVSDTFAFVPLLRLTERLPGGVEEVRTLVAIGALVAGALFATIPARAKIALPAAVAVFLLISSYYVFRREEGQALAARASSQTPDASWVDHRIGRNSRAVFLFTSDLSQDPHAYWQTEFWNRSLKTTYELGAPDPTGFPSTATTYDPATGVITPDGVPATDVPRFAVIANRLRLNGRLLAAGPRLSLYRVERPLRLASSSVGVEPDNWTGAAGAYSFFAPGDYGRGNRVRVTVSRAGIKFPLPRATVDVLVGTRRITEGRDEFRRVTARRSVKLRAGETKTVTLPRPRFPFRLEVRVSPIFTPSDYNQPDRRDLGARIGVRFVR